MGARYRRSRLILIGLFALVFGLIACTGTQCHFQLGESEHDRPPPERFDPAHAPQAPDGPRMNPRNENNRPGTPGRQQSGSRLNESEVRALVSNWMLAHCDQQNTEKDSSINSNSLKNSFAASQTITRQDGGRWLVSYHLEGNRDHLMAFVVHDKSSIVEFAYDRSKLASACYE